MLQFVYVPDCQIWVQGKNDLTCVTKYMYYGPERRWPFIVYS